MLLYAHYITCSYEAKKIKYIFYAWVGYLWDIMYDTYRAIFIDEVIAYNCLFIFFFSRVMIIEFACIDNWEHIRNYRQDYVFFPKYLTVGHIGSVPKNCGWWWQIFVVDGCHWLCVNCNVSYWRSSTRNVISSKFCLDVLFLEIYQLVIIRLATVSRNV